MATKQRYQNPVIGDTINLRLFSYNSNEFADFFEIQKVEIYYLDPTDVSDTNPDGRRLVEEFDGTDVTLEDVGKHLLEVELEQDRYVIGRYIDIWTVVVTEDDVPSTIEQVFDVYPNLWYTTPMPIVYDFSFHFQPNKFRKGSKQYLIIEIVPNVPTAGDLRAYYENLAIVSDLSVSIEMVCGECVPEEEDLRLIADEELVDYREKRYGFYKLDTEEMECGIYNVWFKLEFGENIYLSDKLQIQVY